MTSSSTSARRPWRQVTCPEWSYIFNELGRSVTSHALTYFSQTTWPWAPAQLSRKTPERDVICDSPVTSSATFSLLSSYITHLLSFRLKTVVLSVGVLTAGSLGCRDDKITTLPLQYRNRNLQHLTHQWRANSDDKLRMRRRK